MSSVKVRDHRDILLAPVVSEKSYGLLDENKYTFDVHPDANKTEIKEAIQKIWNVRVLEVNTLNRKGKVKRELQDRTYHYRPAVTRRREVSHMIRDVVDRLAPHSR